MPTDDPPTEHADDPPTEHADDPPAPPTFASLELADGDLVVYDAENHRAWLQSSRAVSLAAHV
ncbi:hypothetical protein N0B31_18395 [Salinirubellus salinus]|uniref:Uncharacterized protein n=1 Tax=Salinirubellus salinus TaxID=1364945 RepID=A0A9E7U7Y3_9EURY|nr:hypothetical protein [Salinirubellus salinus]UWM54076.1 hypothetical protein N0B31_18395 [Salinirubellus salinus]